MNKKDSSEYMNYPEDVFAKVNTLRNYLIEHEFIDDEEYRKTYGYNFAENIDIHIKESKEFLKPILIMLKTNCCLLTSWLKLGMIL